VVPRDGENAGEKQRRGEDELADEHGLAAAKELKSSLSAIMSFGDSSRRLRPTVMLTQETRVPTKASARRPRSSWRASEVENPACSRKYAGWFANDEPTSTVDAQATQAISVRRRSAPLKQS
jgi:hypothetical protein